MSPLDTSYYTFHALNCKVFKDHEHSKMLQVPTMQFGLRDQGIS